MTKSLVQILIVRGKFNRDDEHKQLQMIEYDGVPTLLSPEPRIIINESSNVNLTDFLNQTIEVGSFVSIYFERVNSVEELFDVTSLKAVEEPNKIVGNITFEDDELRVNDKSLYDQIWEVLQGYAATYVYMEINVQK